MSQLRRLRHYLDLSQEEMGGILARHQTAISAAERKGRCGPGLALDILERWPREMMALRLTLEDLIRRPRDNEAAA